MGRRPTPPDRKTINYSVNLTTDFSAHLESVRQSLGLPSVADAIRALLGAEKNWFGLPPYQAERLNQDMKGRNLNFITYVQEVLARHFQALDRQDQENPKSKHR